MAKKHALSTEQGDLPKHVAIIMDGNGRWAKQKDLSRIAGHRAGVKALQNIVNYSVKVGIEVLTVYAFSSENWKRPRTEVSMLMELFNTSLQQRFQELNDNQVRLRFIGDLSLFPKKLQESMTDAENLTTKNTGLVLAVAVNYGGRWDITNAFKELHKKIKHEGMNIEDIDEALIGEFMSLSDLPEPDLFIRTGGEKRVSNYLLWQLAYTELYFDDCLWPDFATGNLKIAFKWYAGRERRFGCTSEQIGNA
ncbi:MAG: undecaprenyl diphosphate synthase [Gammaproteobacteria bacterium]|jgi:undecaprenyl diphosphate synthase